MKHLSAPDLEQLDAAWADFAQGRCSRRQVRIRRRLHFVYLLIRHGGLRLGEALALDDRKDLVFSTNTVHVGTDRDIQMPAEVMARLLRLHEDPELAEVRGRIARVDPGYVRKNFYAVAASCGLDRSLAGPRVLRHSRGAELLNRGIPVTIVQKFLGLLSPVQAVQLKDFQDDEARQILHAHLRRETLRHTSARNVFAGTISHIESNETMAIVTLNSLSDLQVVASVSMESLKSLSLHRGQTVSATVKAPWVTLSPEGTTTSMANNFPGTVLFVREGSLEASVRVRLDDGTGMAALMGLEAVRRLDLRQGSRCTVSFSLMAVVINPG